MVQIQLINSVIDWERRLEFTDEKRKNYHSEPYVNYLAAPCASQNERFGLDERQAPVDFVRALNPTL